MLCCCGHLKAELQRLRKRGALRPGLDPERSCARCLSPLGRVLNRGAQCPVCRKKVCKDCRLYDSGVVTSPTSGTPTPSTGSGSNNNATHWICVLCQKQLELKATSGQWMQASPSSSSAGSLRGAAAAPAAAAGASALPYGAGGGGGSSGGSLGSYRRRSLQGGSPPVVVSPILSAPNSVPATPQHGSRLPPGSTVLPTPVLPAQLQAAASNPEHIPRKFLAAQAYYKLQQQQSNGGGPSAVSDNIHNDNTNNNNDNNSGCGNVREFVADEGATAAAVAGVTDDRDVSETETASPVDIVVYDDVSLPPRAPSSASIDQPCDLPCADLSHHHNQHHLNHQKHHNLNHQSNYHLTITQPELDVPSAPLKFGPGFDGPSQRQTPPPSRSQSPRTPHRRSPAPRTSSAQPSSPSTSPSPSMNGVPPRWALIDRSPLNNNNLTKGSTGAKTSSQSSLNSDASLGLGSGALSTPHHLPLGATAANAQQTRYNSVNNSHNNTAASKEAVLPPAKPKRFDERAIDCGGGGGGSSNNNNNYNNNNVASLGSKSKGRLAVDQQGSPSGAGGLTSTGNQSPRPAIGLRGNSSAAAASEPANAVAGGPTTGPVQQPPQQPLSGQPVPLSWRARREGAPSPLQLVDSHAGSASPQLGQAGILRQQQQCRPHSSPAAGHGGSTLSSGGSSLSSYSGSGIGAHLGAAITGQRASSPANSDASSKNDESVIFRRVTIKKKVESNSSSTGSGDTQPYKRISTPRGSTGLQGDSHDELSVPHHQAVIGLCAPLETAHPCALAIDPLKCLPLSNRYPDLLTSSNLVQFEDDLRSSTSTLHSAADMESNCSASPMIRRLQAHIRARASFRMACAAPLSCSSEDDRDATLTREATPPPLPLGASQEKILPEDYQLVFITSSESFSDLSDYDEQGRKKRRRRKKRSTLKVKSRLEIGSGAYYIEDSEWEFTSDSDYRMAASLCSLDEISDVEENLKEKAKIIEQKSASLEDLPGLFTRTGSVRLKRNNSVRRSMRKSMRLKNNPLLMKQKRAEENGGRAPDMIRECHKCGGVKTRPLKTAPPAAAAAASATAMQSGNTHRDEPKDVRKMLQDDTSTLFDAELDLVQDQQQQQQQQSGSGGTSSSRRVHGLAAAVACRPTTSATDDTPEGQRRRYDHVGPLTDTAARVLRGALDSSAAAAAAAAAVEAESAGCARFAVASHVDHQNSAGGHEPTSLAGANMNTKAQLIAGRQDNERSRRGGGGSSSCDGIDINSSHSVDGSAAVTGEQCSSSSRSAAAAAAAAAVVVVAADAAVVNNGAVLVVENASAEIHPLSDGGGSGGGWLGDAANSDLAHVVGATVTVTTTSDNAAVSATTTNGSSHHGNDIDDDDGPCSFALQLATTQAAAAADAAAATTASSTPPSTYTSVFSYNAVVVGNGHSVCGGRPAGSSLPSCASPSPEATTATASDPVTSLQDEHRINSGSNSTLDNDSVNETNATRIPQQPHSTALNSRSSSSSSAINSGSFESGDVTSAAAEPLSTTTAAAAVTADSELLSLRSADRVQSAPPSADDSLVEEPAPAEATAGGAESSGRCHTNGDVADCRSGGILSGSHRCERGAAAAAAAAAAASTEPPAAAMVLLEAALDSCAGGCCASAAAIGGGGGGGGGGRRVVAHRSSPAGACLTRAPWPDPRLALSVAADCGEVRFLPAGYVRGLTTTSGAGGGGACVLANSTGADGGDDDDDCAVVFAVDGVRGGGDDQQQQQQQQQQKKRNRGGKVPLVGADQCVESTTTTTCAVNRICGVDNICEPEDYRGLSAATATDTENNRSNNTNNNDDDDIQTATTNYQNCDSKNHPRQKHQNNNSNSGNRRQQLEHCESGGTGVNSVDVVECSVELGQQEQRQGILKYFPVKDALGEPQPGVVSSLEKYFTEELLIPQQNFDCFDDYDSDQEPPIPPAQGYLIEEEILSDVSTSSDDLFALPPTQQQPEQQQQQQQLLLQASAAAATMYGNPHAFSLHTIVEDSCEESEHSAPSSPQVPRQPSDLEQYFSYAIGNATEDEQKRWSVVSEDLSDTVSEASYVSEVTEEDPSLLASSRLEKYFTNLVGGCPDTFSLKDEREVEEEVKLQSGCFEEDTFNTIKRNKKTNKGCSPSKEVGEQDELDSSRDDGDVTVIEVTAGQERTLSANSLAGPKAAVKSPPEAKDNILKLEVNKGGKAKDDSSEDDQVAKMDIDDDDEEDEADMAKIVDVVEKTPSPEHLDEIDNLQKPLKAIRLAEQLENIAIEGKMKHDEDSSPAVAAAQSGTEEAKTSVKERVTKMNNAYVEQTNAINKPKISPRGSPRKSSPDTGKKVSFKGEEVPDEEVAYVMNRVIAHISGSPDVDRPTEKDDTPGWKSLLEDHIASLMQSVSPYNNSAGSTVTSSNNSDYGSDTLESEEYTTEDDNNKKNKEDEVREALSDETLFICRKLMTSLKQLSSKSPSPPLLTEYAKAQEYIHDQIVALMHTVTSSRNGSPTMNLKERKKPQGSPNLSEKQSESGSETVSASISIPSYDSDETSATEPVNSQEMEELYNMLSDNVSLSKLSCCDGETDHKTMITVSAPVPAPRTKTPPKCGLSPLQAIRISSPSAKYDSTSTLTTGSDTDFAGSVETVLEVKTTSDATSPEPDPDSADMSRSESSLYVKAKKLSNRGSDHLSNKLAKSKAASKSEYSIAEVKGDDDNDPMAAKSVSEHNLFATASEQDESSVNPSQSEDNILETQRSRDTGYYSFKSSDESVEQQAVSSQAIERTSEPVRPARSARQTGGKQSTPTPTVQHALSTPNIHEAFANGKFSTLPLKPKRMEVPQEAASMTLKPNKEKHFSSSFFSTSAVLRKLTLKAEEPSGPGGSPGLRSARFRSRGGRGSDVDSASSNDNLHQLGVFSKSHTSLSTLGSTATVNHPGGRSESMTSVYSAAGAGRYGAVAVTGEVNFGLSYDLRQGVLSVLVREAKNLAAVDEKRNRSDPYVKVYLLPDRSKSGKRKTKVRKHTLNPVFNEVLRFSVERTELTSRTLWLSVWHCDIFGRNDFLGEVMKDLSSDMLETNTSHWYPLQERVDALDGGSLVVGGGLGGPLGGAYKGDLILSLKWAPHDHRPGRGSLHIIVKEASNLQATRSNGTSDPFCKCYLLPDRHKTSKQKTAVVRRSTTPVWNHPFVYHDVSLAELRERALELTIWDYDKITSNDFLGGVRLSLGTGKYQNSLVDWMDAQGEEIRLWRQMLDKPNQWVDGCLLLRASMN